MDILSVMGSFSYMESRQLTLGEMQALYLILPIGGLIGVYVIAHILQEKRGWSVTRSRLTAVVTVIAAAIAAGIVIRLIFGRQTGFQV